MDELRIEIWDFLFRAKQSKSIGEIAEFLGQEIDLIRAAVSHEWFTVENESVSISR